MKPNIGKTLVGGIAGMLLMTLLMRLAAPLLIESPMDIAAMLGSMVEGIYVLGMTIHVMLGILFFPLLYALLAYRLLPGSPWVKGLLFGTLLWLLALTIIMPVVGAGFFMSEIGGLKPALVALLSHWVYGVLIGAVAGGADRFQHGQRSYL